jgi:hypothetical protein
MIEKATEWLDYVKINKSLFDIYNKTNGTQHGYLRKVLNGDDWLITDGYIAFRIPDDKLIIRPSVIENASDDVAKTVRSIFSFDQKAQRIEWTPRCVMSHNDTKPQRFYTATDKSFAVLLGEELLKKVNNKGMLSLYSSGTISPVQLIDYKLTAIYAIILPCRFNDNDAAAILPSVI